jgi:hypothetical protein
MPKIDVRPARSRGASLSPPQWTAMVHLFVAVTDNPVLTGRTRVTGQEPVTGLSAFLDFASTIVGRDALTGEEIHQ